MTPMVLSIWHFADLCIRHSTCFGPMIPLKGAQPHNVQLDFEMFLLIINFNKINVSFPYLCTDPVLVFRLTLNLYDHFRRTAVTSLPRQCCSLDTRTSHGH
jgi:hypothetical protein